jgi:hypothetical protein
MHQGTFRRYAIDIFGKWFCLLADLPSDVAKARRVKLKRLGCLEARALKTGALPASVVPQIVRR